MQSDWCGNIPETFNERSIGWQQNLSYSQPQGFTQFLVRYNPQRLLRVKLFKLRIESFKPAKTKA